MHSASPEPGVFNMAFRVKQRKTNACLEIHEPEMARTTRHPYIVLAQSNSGKLRLDTKEESRRHRDMSTREIKAGSAPRKEVKARQEGLS